MKVYANCPRSECGAEQEVDVDLFYEGGWVAQFQPPTECPDGHQWTEMEIRAVSESITEKAVEPRDPIIDD